VVAQLVVFSSRGLQNSTGVPLPPFSAPGDDKRVEWDFMSGAAAVLK